MNSPNQPNRQYHHNTCELSIEDKKSPFPAWMKFNKPNPLKFNLSLQDPDRPEQPPITISGDRVKLDTLHQTVEEYVGNLLAKAPLQIQESPPISAEIHAAASSDVNIERPIDALKMTGDRPHLEADGPSRHLLYLGNMADDGQVMASLSTLQLFDLSSTLDESAQPLAVTATAGEASTEDSSAALGSMGTAIEPEPTAAAVIPAIVPPAPPAAAGPMVVQKFETDVEEPRVVLPSVKEATMADGLESESSFFERNSTVDNTDRFKMPKPSLGSLNLPELPDFSNSPLTSIWLWLGLGTVATGIVAFPFLSKSFNENLASKPAVQSTPSASATNSDLAGIPSYQPSPAATPSGLNSSPTASPGATTSPNSGQVTLTPTQSSYGTTPGTTSNVGGLVNSNIGNSYNTSRTGANAKAPTGQNTNARNQATGKAPAADRTSTASRFGNSTNSSLNSNNPTPLRRASDVLGSNRTARRDNTNLARNSTPTNSNSGTISDPSGISEFNAKTSEQDPIATSSRSTESSRPGRTRARAATTAATTASSPQTDLVGQGQSLTGENDSSINNPVPSIPADNSPTLSSPNGSRLGDSPQVDSTRQYFQTRWRADPNFTESLQYNVRVGKDGKVVSVDGQTVASREYLKRTRFISPGNQVAGSGSQDQSTTVILKPDGSVEAIGNP
jgi:Domain of unknown function (DUF4335)